MDEPDSDCRGASSPSRLRQREKDVLVAKVRRQLYERFFRGYMRKQWQRDPSEEEGDYDHLSRRRRSPRVFLR